MLGEAKNAGQAGGNTTSVHNGMGKSAYKPSNDYLARISAIIKRNTHFDAQKIKQQLGVSLRAWDEHMYEMKQLSQHKVT